MVRNRLIKAEFWSDKKLMRVSRNSRLTFIGLWNFADDMGVLLNSPRQILGDLYPLDSTVSEKDIKAEIKQLVGIGVLVEFSDHDADFLHIKNWTKHQTIQHPSKRSCVTHETLMRHSQKNYLESQSETQSKEQSELETQSAKPAPPMSEIDHDFLEWWQRYPKPEGKSVAAKAWKSAIKKHGHGPIRAATQNYLAKIQAEGTATRFVKNPATFLNQVADFIDGVIITETKHQKTLEETREELQNELISRGII